MANVLLPVRNQYSAKDQRKADLCTKFIGRGSTFSSTRAYQEAFGALANSGEYTKDDLIFVSAEGNRRGRVLPDFNELLKAIEAKASFITDDFYNRQRPYNVGEREVVNFLSYHGYTETNPGIWRLI